MIRFTVATAAALLSLAIGARADEPFAIRAAAYVDAAGELRSNALIVIRGRSIVGVITDAKPPADMPITLYQGAVVSPGLIDINASLGADGPLSERQTAVQPGVTARDAFNRYHRQFRAALRAGVTGVGLSPDDSNIVGGRIAICKTAGSERGPYILSGDGPMKLSLSPDVFQADRAPTSRGGAIAMLRGVLESARGSSDGSPMAALATGELSGFVAAPSGTDVLSILRIAQDYSLKLTLLHQSDVTSVAEAIAGAKVGVIVGPFDFSSSQRSVRSAGLLEQRGVPVAIAGGLPRASADSLRLGAALAAREGLSLPAARRAITSVPAEFLGVADRIGTIQKGRAADLVIFSGDPLDLRSRVLAVYVDGRRVYAAPDTRALRGARDSRTAGFRR